MIDGNTKCDCNYVLNSARNTDYYRNPRASDFKLSYTLERKQKKLKEFWVSSRRGSQD